MPKKISFIAIVPENTGKETCFYAYFLCKKTKQIISVKVTKNIVDIMIKKTDNQRNLLPNIVEILKIKKIILFKEKGGKFQTIIKTGHRIFSKNIITPFPSGFITSQLFNVPLEITDKTLKKEGIYVTKELLKVSLA
jgi:hypothetical protein